MTVHLTVHLVAEVWQKHNFAPVPEDTGRRHRFTPSL